MGALRHASPFPWPTSLSPCFDAASAGWESQAVQEHGTQLEDLIVLLASGMQAHPACAKQLAALPPPGCLHAGDGLRAGPPSHGPACTCIPSGHAGRLTGLAEAAEIRPEGAMQPCQLVVTLRGVCPQTTNNLNGTLPSLSNFGDLAVFAAGSNRFTGTIPADWASPQLLEIFSVHDNKLTGSLPRPTTGNLYGNRREPLTGLRGSGVRGLVTVRLCRGGLCTACRLSSRGCGLRASPRIPSLSAE